jgi:hypothetical protein
MHKTVKSTLAKFAKFAKFVSGESEQNGWQMSGECIESGQSRVANVGVCIESGQFSKMAILASTQIRQNWQIFGKYSNSTNSPASGHCLVNTTPDWERRNIVV